MVNWRQRESDYQHIGGAHMELQQKIEQYISSIDASFGISVKHLETQEETNIQGDRLFQMASVVKVPILAALFELAERGEIDLSQRIKMRYEEYVPGSGVFKAMDSGIEPTIKDLATMMIIVSDNQATDKLLKLVDGAEAVEEKMRSIGLENIHIKHSIWELLSPSAGVSPNRIHKQLQRKCCGSWKKTTTTWRASSFRKAQKATSARRRT